MAAQLMATNGFGGAAAMAVDGAGHDLLAGAGLAGDQHAGVAVGEHADGFLDGAHGGGGADQGVFVGVGRLCGGAGGGGLEHAGDQRLQLGEADGLGQVVDGAEAHGFDGVGGGGDGGEDGDGRWIRAGADAGEDLHAVQARHAQVQQHGVDAASVEAGQGFLAVGGEGGGMAEIGEGFGEAFSQARVVVHDQDGAHGVKSWGSSMAKRAPGAALMSWSVPLWAWTISRAMARPRPVPSGRPVTKGSNRLSRRDSGTPGPVSSTSKRSFSRVASMRRVTWLLWRQAFWMRLSSARRIMVGSNWASSPWRSMCVLGQSASRAAAKVARSTRSGVRGRR